jgi:hypothetical protein
MIPRSDELGYGASIEAIGLIQVNGRRGLLGRLGGK